MLEGATQAWYRLVQIIEASSGRLLAGILIACAILFCVTTIGFATRVHQLRNRHRSLAGSMEDLGHRIKKDLAEMEARLAALEENSQQIEQSARGTEGPTAAQLREEIESLQLGLRSPELASEPESEDQQD
jgi:hypothetical protein